MNFKRLLSVTALSAVAITLAHALPANAAAGPNLVPNPDLELSSPAWTPGKWGTNNASFTTTTGELSGSKAASIAISSYTDGAAEWISPLFNVSPGQYTFQDSYKSNAYTEVGGTLTLTDGTSKYLYIGTLAPTPTQDLTTMGDGTTSVPTDANVWKRSDISVTLPTNAKSLQIFHILPSAGFLSSDAYSFFTGVTAPPITPAGTELVANAGMEQASGGVPAGWSQGGWGNSVRKFTYVSGGAHGGTKSVRVDVSSYVDGDAKWTYDAVPVTGGAYYVYSDWYKSSADTAASMYFEDANGVGSWANLFLGIPANNTTSWKQFKSGIIAPTSAVRAYIAHFIPRNGFLALDDVSMKQSATPAGFDKARITLGYDDGSASIYSNALPVLDQYGFKSTQFVPTGDMISNRNPDGYVWSAAQIKNVYQRGHEIAGHSVTHPMMTTLTARQLQQETVNNKTTLDNAIGVRGKVVSFAEPYGDYNSTVINAIFAAGFTNARSVDVGYNTKNDLMASNIHVQNIKLTTTFAEFKSWVDLAIANKYYLNLVFHEVSDQGDSSDPDGDAYRVTTSMHRQMIEYLNAQKANITVETQAQAMSELSSQVSQ